MKTADELRRGQLGRRAEEFRSASQDRDVERMLALFADDAQVTMAPGTFRGKAAIRKFFEWETRMAPVATSKDTGLGLAVVGRSVVWECQVSETVQGVPYTTVAASSTDPPPSIITARPGRRRDPASRHQTCTREPRMLLSVIEVIRLRGPGYSAHEPGS